MKFLFLSVHLYVSLFMNVLVCVWVYVWCSTVLYVRIVSADQWIRFSKMGYCAKLHNNMLHYKSNKILGQVVLIVPNDKNVGRFIAISDSPHIFLHQYTGFARSMSRSPCGKNVDRSLCCCYCRQCCYIFYYYCWCWCCCTFFFLLPHQI